MHHKKVTLSCPVLRNIEESGIKTSPNIGELFIKYPFKLIELGDKYWPLFLPGILFSQKR